MFSDSCFTQLSSTLNWLDRLHCLLIERAFIDNRSEPRLNLNRASWWMENRCVVSQAFTRFSFLCCRSDDNDMLIQHNYCAHTHALTLIYSRKAWVRRKQILFSVAVMKSSSKHRKLSAWITFKLKHFSRQKLLPTVPGRPTSNHKSLQARRIFIYFSVIEAPHSTESAHNSCVYNRPRASSSNQNFL